MNDMNIASPDIPKLKNCVYAGNLEKYKIVHAINIMAATELITVSVIRIGCNLEKLSDDDA